MFFKKNYITLNEFWKKNQRNFKQLAVTIILKLLISDYSVKGDFVIVKLGNDYIKIHNSDTPEKNGITFNFWNAYSVLDSIYYIFLSKIKGSEYSGNLIGALNYFKRQHIVSGKSLKGKKFYKMYYGKKPENIMYSKDSGRSWIDYDRQLRKGNIIYDSNRGTVIWGMMPKYKNQMVESEDARKHYGNKILIIEPLPRMNYVKFEKEIIGKRFKVVGKKQLF